ncbi:hypothetical protein [Dyella sp.]|uniref:hypothetical protein n=1 Tax=Dyella sp. TaxID=1869338 RepID=UPI002FD93360
MKLMLIDYDLKAPGRNYNALQEAIKASPGWWHYMESNWVVATNETVRDLQSKLNALIDANDRLLIVDISNCEVGGWLPRDAWDWLKKNGAR